MATVALKTITRTDREERVSRNGNPRYLVTFDDGTSARTAVDAAVAFGIASAEFANGDAVSVWFENGEVIGVRNGQGISCGSVDTMTN